MAKIALLIGVSDYESGLDSLPGTQADIRAMQGVLQNPAIGGFDTVYLLPDPELTQMQYEIEKLFSENRSRDDLILLYFSGHGVRDDNGSLYFATRTTQKNSQGRIFTSTAVPASFIQHCMSQSRSKRQVLILDSCFSGAFAKDMKAKQADEIIDVKAQLGGEGRAVLTSSTATQVSYEKEGASIYTRYLVQGLETGAADLDNNGQITVDELHEYAREKVQEAAPTMQPEIYAVREGYKILVGRAPQGDPKLTYRKAVDERAKQKRGRLSPVDQRALRFHWQELGLSASEAESIAQEVLQPYQVFWAKLDEFEQAVKETLDYDPQLSATSLEDLQYFQRVLKLRQEDIAPILDTYRIRLDRSEPITPFRRIEFPAIVSSILPPDTILRSGDFAPAASPPAQDDLSSKLRIDYTHLRDLLKAGDWKEADQETYRVMAQAFGKKDGEWFTSDELLNFPCVDLKTIDRVWVKYSKGHFGFSVQKQIYVESGAKLDGQYPGDKTWNEFGDRVGWRVKSTWIHPGGVTFSTSAPRGHLPLLVGGRGARFCSLLSHRDL
ncbi:GUN4 domain-containing protein [Kovacikia minuta CCNUW1]|uniref:caspase, EACC1-associated type n=1 Tax=Kovacikia minuta TaxID=2931930 RepID=UPI001CC9FF70|nr:GUN4 domain-containing protein [Kovacikia minuta]UBF25469.1 GUN4 domain-containing protein [Kovacikia minuta CCNUW1]